MSESHGRIALVRAKKRAGKKIIPTTLDLVSRWDSTQKTVKSFGGEGKLTKKKAISVKLILRKSKKLTRNKKSPFRHGMDILEYFLSILKRQIEKRVRNTTLHKPIVKLQINFKILDETNSVSLRFYSIIKSNNRHKRVDRIHSHKHPKRSEGSRRVTLPEIQSTRRWPSHNGLHTTTKSVTLCGQFILFTLPKKERPTSSLRGARKDTVSCKKFQRHKRRPKRIPSYAGVQYLSRHGNGNHILHLLTTHANVPLVQEWSSEL